MRRLGFFLLFAGLVAIAVGAFVGCGTLFAWNGRHAVAEWELVQGTPLSKPFEASRGTRYTAGVIVVFDRGDAGAGGPRGAEVHARLPLVASIVDAAGNPGPRVVGWLDPEEPPTMLFGRSVSPRTRGAAVPELAAERLVGPWIAPRTETARVDVDLGPDRSEHGTRIVSTRVVLYDDAKPTAAKAGIGLAAAGIVAFVVGAILAVGAVVRGRGGKRAREMV